MTSRPSSPLDDELASLLGSETERREKLVEDLGKILANSFREQLNDVMVEAATAAARAAFAVCERKLDNVKLDAVPEEGTTDTR